MRKLLILVLVIFCAGCVTVKIPRYLKDEFPYQQTYYADFDSTLNATLAALKENGWTVSDTARPSVFEQKTATQNEKDNQVLLFTDVRQTPFFLSSRYMSLNVYVVGVSDNQTDVEIRYLSVTPLLFKSTESYKNDAVVNKIFNRIGETLP